MIPNGLEFIRRLSWPDVFGIWESAEAHLPHWKPLYKERGFSTWKEWRTETLIAGFRLSELFWGLYRISDPASVIPNFRGGPFRSWIAKVYAGRHSPTPTFAEIAATEHIRGSEAVRRIIENYPSSTTLIGLSTADGVVIVEGTHRSCAAALAASEGRRLAADISLALAEYPFGSLPVLGKERKQQ